MKVTILPCLSADVLDDVFEPHHLVSHLDQVVVAHVDFALTGGGHFVMVHLDVDTQVLIMRQHDLAAQVLEASMGGTGK